MSESSDFLMESNKPKRKDQDMKKGRFMKMALSGTVSVLALMLTAQNVQTEKLNLVENGGFEKDITVLWDGPGTVDNEIFKDGKGSLKLDNKGTKAFMYDQQNITKKLKPSTKYVFSVDIKRTSNEKGRVLAAVLEKENKNNTDWTSIHECGGKGQTGKWEHFELEFTTESEIYDSVVILYNIETEGIVWYDNVSVVEAK